MVDLDKTTGLKTFYCTLLLKNYSGRYIIYLCTSLKWWSKFKVPHRKRKKSELNTFLNLYKPIIKISVHFYHKSFVFQRYLTMIIITYNVVWQMSISHIHSVFKTIYVHVFYINLTFDTTLFVKQMFIFLLHFYHVNTWKTTNNIHRYNYKYL